MNKICFVNCSITYTLVSLLNCKHASSLLKLFLSLSYFQMKGRPIVAFMDVQILNMTFSKCSLNNHLVLIVLSHEECRNVSYIHFLWCQNGTNIRRILLIQSFSFFCLRIPVSFFTAVPPKTATIAIVQIF